MQPSGNAYLDLYRSSGSYGAKPVAAPAAQKSKGPGGVRGFLINNLPAIGGGLGAVAGIPLDFLGGAGSIVGGGVGAGLGEHIKQNLLGENKGNLGEQLKNDAIEGGESALLGGIGKGVGLAKGAAQAAFESGGKSAAENAAGKVGGNVLQRFFDKNATSSAKNAYADQVVKEFGNGGLTESSNGIPINRVLANLQEHNIAPGVTNMSKYGNAGFAYNDVLNNAIVPKGQPFSLDLGKVVQGAMKSQPGLTVPDGFRGKLISTITDSLDPEHANISGIYHPADILKAAQDLYAVKPGSAAEGAVYSSARKALIEAAGKEGGLNDAIKAYKLPSVQQVMSQDGGTLPGAGDVEHILESAGHNPKLAQQMVDNLNKAGSIQEIQKAELPHIAANEIAASHANAIGQTLPKALSEGGFSMTGSTANELGQLARGNVGAAVPLVTKAALNPLQRLAGKLGTPNMAEVGPPKIPSLAGAAEEAAPAVAGAAEQVAPAAAQAGPNILSRLAGGAKDLATVEGPGLRAPLSEQLPNVTAAAQGAAGAVKGAANFGKRMAAAPLAYPGKTALSIGKQAGGRAVGGFLLDGGQPGGDAPQGPDALTQLAHTPGEDAQGAPGALGGAGGGQDAAGGVQYSQAQLLSDIAADPKNSATYESLYKMLASSDKPANSAEANTMSNSKVALDQLSGLENDITSGNGSTGPVSGRLRSLNPYDSQQQSLQSNMNIAAQLVAKGLEGGKLSDQDIKRYRSMLPSSSDTTEVALGKIAHVRSLLEDQLNNYSSLVGQSANQ